MDEIQKKNKELCEKMPYLIPRNVWTDKIADYYDYSYILGQHSLPKGWQKLFLQMCKDIRQPLIDANYLDEFRFSQIKEKYNRLCAYNFGAPDIVHDIIWKYEYISQFICQDCGAPATLEYQGWLTSYCDDCFKKLGYENMKVEPIKFDPILRINGYANGEEYTKEIDCSDIWYRLYEE